MNRVINMFAIIVFALGMSFSFTGTVFGVWNVWHDKRYKNIDSFIYKLQRENVKGNDVETSELIVFLEVFLEEYWNDCDRLYSLASAIDGFVGRYGMSFEEKKAGILKIIHDLEEKK